MVATVAAAAWWRIGYLVAFTLVGLAVIATLAAIVDARLARLPNSATGGASALVAVSVPLVALVDDRSVAEVAGAAGWGIAFSGAPLLFAIWLLRPNSIGGGDWKMLAAVGAGIGLALPFAALVMTTIACLVQIVASAIRRQQVMPFGPSIAVGYAAAVLLLPILVPILGGPYA